MTRWILVVFMGRGLILYGIFIVGNKTFLRRFLVRKNIIFLSIIGIFSGFFCLAAAIVPALAYKPTPIPTWTSTPIATPTPTATVTPTPTPTPTEICLPCEAYEEQIQEMLEEYYGSGSDQAVTSTTVFSTPVSDSEDLPVPRCADGCNAPVSMGIAGPRWPPSAAEQACCVQHDYCFQNPGTSEDETACDDQFFECLENIDYGNIVPNCLAACFRLAMAPWFSGTHWAFNDVSDIDDEELPECICNQNYPLSNGQPTFDPLSCDKDAKEGPKLEQGCPQYCGGSCTISYPVKGGGRKTVSYLCEPGPGYEEPPIICPSGNVCTLEEIAAGLCEWLDEDTWCKKTVVTPTPTPTPTLTVTPTATPTPTPSAT